MNEEKCGPKPKACTDEVLLEIWRIKDELSAARGHSLDKLIADTRERQKHSGHIVVDLSDLSKSPATAMQNE